MKNTMIVAVGLLLGSCGTNPSATQAEIEKEEKMELTNKQKAIALVKAFETGDSKALEYVSDQNYTQHNLAFPDGKEAIAGFFTDQPTGITVEIHRAFEDENLVALHSTYGGVWNNGSPQVAFDVFRFEDGLMVEHWDNLLDVAAANASGRTQTDGTTTITDLDQQNANKNLVQEMMDAAFIGGDYSNITKYISTEQYLQHNPQASDGLEGFNEFVTYLTENNITMSYDECPYMIAEGNFVLTLASGSFGEQAVAYYDLFRLEEGKVVEHWDIISNIPPQSEWNNNNGKFKKN